jgi:hypothetical protein
VTRPSDEEIADRIATHIQEQIAEYGIAIMAVGRYETGDKNFCYTIGLYEHLGYELLIIGPPANQVAGIFALVSAYYKHKGVKPSLGTREETYSPGLPLRFHPVTDEKVHDKYTVQADVHYGKKVPVVQVWVPDRHGRFMDEPGNELVDMPEHYHQPKLFSTTH